MSRGKDIISYTIKENTLEENRKKKGGARLGHKGNGRGKNLER